jgi:hypothetical protein
MDVGKILGGIAIATVVAAGPLWVATVRGGKAEAPLPSVGAGACLETKDSMRRNHPALLAAWRAQRVRLGEPIYRTRDGRDVRIGLGETCLGCHGQASMFCDRCHAQVGVAIACWQCHPRSPMARQ